jgi:S-adenosyl-L-methionine hydrolase (adenosine-forming)
MAIITLTTDFGARDHFAGVLKGVALSIAPKASVVDITHDIEPFAVAEGAFTLAEAWRWFPKKTIHVAIVDPGVGSVRRPILVEAGGHYFVGPDNGIFGLIYAREKARVRHLKHVKYFLSPVSQTFHGRDVFAPVAGHLAAGVRPALLGPVIADYLRPGFDRPTRTSTRTWNGAVLKVDRFGNLITNFHVADFPDLLKRPISMVAGIHPIDYLVRHYAEAAPGEPVAIIGSSGYLEVIVNRESAARRLGCGAGAPVELSIL